MEYDTRAKRYVAAAKFVLRFLEPDPYIYLSQLRSVAEGAVPASDSWIAALADYLETQRHPRPQARAMATTIVTSLEGTVILCRARRSVEALRDTATVLGSMLDHASSQTEALR